MTVCWSVTDGEREAGKREKEMMYEGEREKRKEMIYDWKREKEEKEG